ncbi:hypothetical protein PsorP6_015696 [Peronosclerospora sorghi]|uniref:Uncharacterized protein n=1 Tax=Peronosclerospora sorghi TaxID=230839 RepID=A0ACC0WNE8_9STRA|nr:hypothetical protein PsorP6_015696 [Peronosclerospora sorghi]
MDTVHALIDYLETFPPEAGADELKSQLSAFMHQDLRVACMRLNLPISRRQNKKSGFISILVAYWKAAIVGASVPHTATFPQQSPRDMEEPDDVAQLVQFFPPHGHVEELQHRLNASRARTLRSACVLLALHPKKSFTKPELIDLLVNYWQDSLAVSPRVPLVEEPRRDEESASPASMPTGALRTTPLRKVEEEGYPSGTMHVPQEVEVVYTKRPRSEERPKPLRKKKNKGVDEHETTTEPKHHHVLDKKMERMAASMEKAKVVKEWASAIEILSRVDGSAESISAIRTLIHNVVESATSEL